MSDIDNKWGVGNQANSPAIRNVLVGKHPVDIIFGEHKHSYSSNNFYARFSDGRIEEFDGHHVLTRIELIEHNYLKTSGLSGNEVRKGGQATIYFNDNPVYGFFFRDVSDALLEANHVLPRVREIIGPCNGDTSELVGRKIYYRDVPATITRFIGDQGCVIIEAEQGKEFPPPAWAKEEDGFYDHDENRTNVKTSILSEHIWWFRN